MVTPTFLIDGRRYDGPWDESSLSDAMLGTLGHRVRSAALDFVSWGPSAGLLLLIARCWRWHSPTRSWGLRSRRSGIRTSASLSATPAFACRCAIGSMTGC
jgi:hypothetical protein